MLNFGQVGDLPQQFSKSQYYGDFFQKDNAYFFDLNSCAPSSKRKSCKSIESNGGYYVDVAVMAPVSPKKHLVPVLISGDKAFKAIAALEKFPMNAKVIVSEK